MPEEAGSATIRQATAADGAALAAIYAPYVLETAISFETEPPTAAEMADRVASAHRWIVAEHGGRVVGYAYAGPHRARAAYAGSAEVSVYVDPAHHGRGLGRALYTDLLAWLAADPRFHRALAGMTVPNPGSEALHLALGFTVIGDFVEVGHKLGRWHDTRWFQRPV